MLWVASFSANCKSKLSKTGHLLTLSFIIRGPRDLNIGACVVTLTDLKSLVHFPNKIPKIEIFYGGKS